MKPKPLRRAGVNSSKDQTIKPYSHVDHAMGTLVKPKRPSIYSGKPPRARRNGL